MTEIIDRLVELSDADFEDAVAQATRRRAERMARRANEYNWCGVCQMGTTEARCPTCGSAVLMRFR